MGRRYTTAGRAFSRGPKNNIWSVVTQQDTALAADTNDELNIVDGADWTGSAGAESATLLRIRGYLGVAPDAATDGAFQWYIARFDNDAASPSPTLPATYVDEDILATGGYQFEASAGNAKMWEIDVKAMRRIGVGDEVRLVMRSISTATRNTVVARGLVRKGGN